jgi:glycosyltransferase involved in cell wall biosynthesis
MKILMTADAVGGVWTYALDLSAALAEHDVSVLLATMGPRPNDAQRAAAHRLDNVQLIESDFRLEWMADPWSDVAAAGTWLQGLAAAGNVDVVHLNGYTHASLSWHLPVVCVAHSCVSSWWQAVHGTLPPAQWSAYRRHVALGLNSADRVIAPTQAFLDQLRTCYDLHRPAQVIRNARKSLAANRGESSERLPVVLACGRPWDAAKNIGVFDTAAAGLSWHAYLVGNTLGPDGKSFTPTSLRSLGTLSARDVETWLRRATIFVHPALYEPFGLAVLEAASAGCALVLADIPSLRESWDGAAEFFDPGDGIALRAVLDALIAQPSRRTALAAAAQERAGGYRIESMAAAYLQVYQTVAGTPSRERTVA